MTHYIDLLSIQTPKHLRKGFENRTRYHCGNFEINIFETFQSSTKVQIQYEGLSISGMIRGHKIVTTKEGERFEFLPGTSLILPEGEIIFADFPNADEKNPVQCATILIPHDTMELQMNYLDELYPKENKWELDFQQFHFANNSGLVRAFNEILQLTQTKNPSSALKDLLLKSFLVRIVEAQRDFTNEQNHLQLNNQLLLIKKYIKENLQHPLHTEVLMEIGNCSKSSLFRMFENYCSKTPGEYVLHERMALARNLLLNPNHSISEVAFLSGFSSDSYFSKQFKAHNHCTPKEFVKRFGL
jgi:AraC family transcriptional regulator